MTLSSSILMLAADAPATTQSGGPPFIVTAFPLLLLVFVFYFIIIRPQQKKARELEAQVKSLKPGDRIVTTSGIVGTVLGIKEKFITLRSEDSKLELTKSAVAEIIERKEDSASAA